MTEYIMDSAKLPLIDFMKYKSFVTALVILLLVPFISFTQKIITGTVLREKTGLPVEGASVFFNNTSIGTSANAEGKFSLATPGFSNAELIISAIGYELQVYNPASGATQMKNLLFKLATKEQQLREVLILPDALRKKYLSIFERNFLGITEEASHSRIENRKDIYFTSGDGKNSFRAYSDTPLVIINKMLGYKISFDLVDFLFNQELGRTFYYGYIRFEELSVRNKWVKNRKRCYYGSTVHFFRSLIANRLKEEAFSMYLLKPLQLSTDSLPIEKGNSFKAPGSGEEMAMAVGVTPEQILQKDSSNVNQFKVNFKGKLMVQYNKDPASKSYLKNKVFIQGNMPVGFRSFITASNETIGLSSTGIIINPMEITYSGFWIYEKTANMLPFNYVPN
jgi:CarboxypepD_reg-like domain